MSHPTAEELAETKGVLLDQLRLLWAVFGEVFKPFDRRSFDFAREMSLYVLERSELDPALAEGWSPPRDGAVRFMIGDPPNGCQWPGVDEWRNREAIPAGDAGT